MGKQSVNVQGCRAFCNDYRPARAEAESTRKRHNTEMPTGPPDAPRIPVLVVTGPVGVGKSAVLHEIDSVLVRSASTHATLEVEEIMRFWGADAAGPVRWVLLGRNVSALWTNFASLGASRLLLGCLLEQRSDVGFVEGVIPGAVLTIVQLRAS